MCFCSENVDFLYRGGVRGCRGGVHGCLEGMHGCRGGMCGCRGGHAWLPGGMRGCWGGACVAAGGCAWLPGGMCGCRGACVAAGGVPCDLSHHAFDVTCMLSPYQLRASSYAPAYILVGHVTRTPPSPVDRQTPVKT